MLPTSPPRYATFSALLAPIKVGEQGWRTFALQKALNSVRFSESTTWPRLDTDGDFGPATLAVVKQFQNGWQPPSDGIAGPRTQAKLLALCGRRSHVMLPDLPDGLMRGFAEGEGANVLAATNWAVAGGVDLGSMQIRVFGPPFPLAAMESAFDTQASMLVSAEKLLARARTFQDSAWVKSHADRREMALRCAVMAHNWPTAGGADRIAMYGKCFNPDGACSWLPRDKDGNLVVRFPDEVLVRTRWEWCQFYALGGPHGEGRITKYVKEWV